MKIYVLRNASLDRDFKDDHHMLLTLNQHLNKHFNHKQLINRD